MRLQVGTGDDRAHGVAGKIGHPVFDGLECRALAKTWGEGAMEGATVGRPRFKDGLAGHQVTIHCRYSHFASIGAPEACTRGTCSMTGRTFFAMLMFAGMIGAVMWFFVLPALTTYRPSLP